MARSSFAQSLLVFVASVGLLAACGAGPSKAAALEAIKAGVKEDGNCTLPLDVLSQLKVQHSTKGVCVPKEGAANAKRCIDALVAAGVTRPMPDAYMLTWPDDLAGVSLKDVSAYERRARNLVYDTCVELGLLRDGRFACADASADKVLSVTALDEKTADVRYSRALTIRPGLPAIEAACGTVVRPLPEMSVSLTREGKGPWTVAPRSAPE
ncbi:MAG: hypothetical protein JWP97_2249 [Labilithrix sp.]|nr:hypothetical protein [Labilithrix sp.]